jgi:hypothetical protein
MPTHDTFVLTIFVSCSDLNHQTQWTQSDLRNAGSLAPARTLSWCALQRHKHCNLVGPAPQVQHTKADPSSIQVFENYLHRYFCVWPLRQYINGGVCKLSHTWSRRRLAATHSGASITVHGVQKRHNFSL